MFRPLACLAAFSAALCAQSGAVSGRFILAEEGSASTSIALLTVDSAGAISGTQYVQASGITQAIAVTGSVTLASDGSGSMTLDTQVATDDGSAPAVVAVYDFLSANAAGFAALRRDSASTALARILPASAEAASTGAYSLSVDGVSASGESVAELGLLQLRADGSLTGRIVAKRNNQSESKTIEGSYTPDPSGFGILKLSSSVVDEEGSTVLQTATYLVAAASGGQAIAMRTDAAAPGLARLDPVR